MSDGLTVLPWEPLARHTAWRTGGACGAWVVAHDLAAVAEVVSDCRAVDWKLTVVGAGTRSVFRDGPIDGAVMRLGTGFTGFGGFGDGAEHTVGAAYPTSALAWAAAAAGRTGLERHGTVAGTIAASILLDDGWDDLVVAVSVLRRDKPVDVPLDEARRKRPIVLAVTLKLAQDDPAKVQKRTVDAWRLGKPAPPSSWYEAPRKGSLRALLVTVRLPMVRLRQVAIPHHAPELLVNLGDGTAADLALLHKSAIERVSKVRGEDLRSRISWFGTAPEAPVERPPTPTGGPTTLESAR